MNELPESVNAYIRATNAGDATAFLACFSEDAAVDDVGRLFRGLEAIREWSAREIFAPRVTLEVLASRARGGETTVTTKVDGNFDRTGLPDPVIIDHQIELGDGKIRRLTCRLAEGVPGGE